MAKKKKARAAKPPGPPATLAAAAKARWLEVVPRIAARGRVDQDLLSTYCQTYARWRQAEEGIAKAGQLVKNDRGRVVANPLIALSNQAETKVRSLEKKLGLDTAEPIEPEPPLDDLMTRRDLAERLAKHPMTITKWESEGMPVAQRGGKGRASRYREVDVRAWLSARAEAANVSGLVDVAQERARKERAQAALAEQMFQVRSGELLPRIEVERVWDAEVVAVRSKLLSIPPTFAERVYQAAVSEGIGGVERMLAVSINEVLFELAGVEAHPA